MTINVTRLTIVDTGTNRIIAIANKSFLGNLLPSKSISIGGIFTMVYYPMFIWKYEYNGKTYTSSHIPFKESFKSYKSTSQKDGLIWLDK